MTFAKPTVRRTITPDDLPAEAATVLAGEARLAMVAAHDDRDGFRMVHTFLAPGQPASELITHLPHSQPALPSLAEISFPAGRFEREVRDLFGITPRDHPLPHRLVRHAHWPTGYHAMRHDAGAPTFEADTGSYPFMQVAGSGVYEIPVGPIHAGLIEPGHFRFSVVGETILRLKARLWFVHRGVEKLFEGRSPDEGIELAERISGDTAVGHTLAYCLAVEEALGLTCSEGDAAARALLLELERLYNHVSDIGAIVNDVGYGIVHAHTQTLREHLLRHNKHVTGHRLLRGAINPGSTTLRNLPDLDLLAKTAASLAARRFSARTTPPTSGSSATSRARAVWTSMPDAISRSLGTRRTLSRSSSRSATFGPALSCAPGKRPNRRSSLPNSLRSSREARPRQPPGPPQGQRTRPAAGLDSGSSRRGEAPCAIGSKSPMAS